MIHVCEHHDALLHLWRAEDRRGISLAHLDFHDDLRGLLVNRRRGRAYPIGRLARGESPADPGNFLAHAVLEGRLERVAWVHDDPGGRAWDMGIVRYSTDFTALPHRLRQAWRRGRDYPLAMSEILLDRWGGLEAGQLLSIDWDCFASILQDAAGIPGRVERFVARLGSERPAETYLVYSPEYSHPSLPAFEALVAELSRRFEQPVEWHSKGLQTGSLTPADVDALLPRDLVGRTIIGLRRLGIY